MNFDQQIIEKHTILRVLVGSTAHGISIGNDDRDEMGVCIEPINYALGLNPFEHLIFRTAIERQKQEIADSQKAGNANHPALHKGGTSPRSTVGDLDLTIYSLRKFIRLALVGNPTIIALLFIKNPIFISKLGQELQDLAPHIVSKRAGKAFLGYLRAQRLRMLGERGGAHGHLDQKDFKYAAHMVRLGIQGIELLSTANISIPMQESDATFIRDIRKGAFPMEQVLERTANLENIIQNLIEVSPLSKLPNTELVEKWMIDAYWKSWN